MKSARFEDEFPEAARVLQKIIELGILKAYYLSWEIKDNGDFLTFKTINNKKHLIFVENFS